MSRIFINYRRDDSAPYAGRLYDHLSAHFGGDQVFMDIDTIRPGVDFVEVIEQGVGSCDACIVVIGKEWLSMTDNKGNRRLDNPNDFVRLEVATALRRNILVIPVLVDKAEMPRAEDLPAELEKLARRNALEVSNERFGYDVKLLIDTLDETLDADTVVVKRPAQPSAPRPRNTRGLVLLGLLAAVLILLIVGLIVSKLVQQGSLTPTIAADNITFSVPTDEPTPEDTSSTSIPDPTELIRPVIDEVFEKLNAGAASGDYADYLAFWDQQSACYASILVPGFGELSIPDYVEKAIKPHSHVEVHSIGVTTYDTVSASVDVDIITSFPNQSTLEQVIRMQLAKRDTNWKVTCLCFVGDTCS